MKEHPFFAKLSKIRAQLPYLPETFRLIWDAARGWTIVWAIILVLQGLLPIALVYLTGALVDSLSAVVSGVGWLAYAPAIRHVAWIALVLLSMQSLTSLIAWIRTTQTELVQDHIYKEIHTKAIELDLSFYDSPGYYDRLYQSRMDAYNRPVALLENIGALFQNTLTFLAMGGILVGFAWWLPLVLIIGMVPVLGVVARTTYREYEWHIMNVGARRRANFYDWIITDRDSAAELRFFGLGDPFRRAYQTIRIGLRSEKAALFRSQALMEIVAGIFALSVMGLVMGWMVWQVFQGEVTLGEVAMLYQAFNQGQKLMQTLLGGLGQIVQNLFFMENLFQFLSLKPKLPVTTVSRSLVGCQKPEISFDGVHFRYPGNQHYALNDFNLVVQEGQTVAIVGENGAGKSTLAKLLCRFYDPQEGVIRINGIDLREINPEELWRSLTVLFQQPVRYHNTAHDNIAYGSKTPEPAEDRVVEAGKMAGAHELISRLPDGYQTVLGSWFGGVELSSGEWQRISLGRTFLRQAPVMVLDEPTSSMDSWAEMEWMSRCRPLMADRTVILITHRFTTARQADMIYVMAAGRIVESGTHQELMAAKGRYAVSWEQQMQGAGSR